MTANEPAGGSRRPRLQRSRRNRIIGGVCAGIAEHLNVDPLLVRIIAVLLGVVSGGAAVLAYLVGWVVIPQADDEPAPTTRVQPPPAATGENGVREAWRAVGNELRTLADGLRTGGPASAEAEASQEHAARKPVEAVDAAMTALGERLRDPDVQAGARRAAAGFSAAVTASFDELGRRTRRAEQTPPSGTDSGNGQG